MSDELAIQNQAQAVAGAIAAMESTGLDYGNFYSMTKLKELAGPAWEQEKKFTWFIVGLTAALRERGFWFTREGLRNEGFRIAQRVENAHYMERTNHEAIASLERGIVLGGNTDLTGLTEAETKRHENVLRQTRHQRLMLVRSEEVIDTLRQHKKGLLRDDVEVEAKQV